MRRGGGRLAPYGAGAFIIVIMSVLCLVIFAAMAGVTANADLALSKKLSKSAGEYYAASSAIEEGILKVDEELYAVAKEGPYQSDREYFEAAAKRVASFGSVRLDFDGGPPVFWLEQRQSDALELRCAIRVEPQGKTSRYRIEAYKSVFVGKRNFDNPLNLWSGELFD